MTTTYGKQEYTFVFWDSGDSNLFGRSSVQEQCVSLCSRNHASISVEKNELHIICNMSHTTITYAEGFDLILYCSLKNPFRFSVPVCKKQNKKTIHSCITQEFIAVRNNTLQTQCHLCHLLAKNKTSGTEE